ncbi:MAG: type VI secretion system baseplate subunit TssG [Chloroflexia bacterium]
MATSRWTEDSHLDSVPAPAEEYSLELRRHWLDEMFGESPGSFQFFQAVRLLSRVEHGISPPGRFPKSPQLESVRFGVNPAFWFPPSQIHSLDFPVSLKEKAPWQPPMLRVNFMGLVGASGVLPLVYSDYLNDRLRERDRSMIEFLDVFHHRMISLFYQAWEKHRFWISYERNEPDRMSSYLLSLVGLGTQSMTNRQAVSDTTLTYYAGLLSLQTRSALALEQFLSDYFDVPIQVEEFGGSWYPLSEEDICAFSDPPTEAEQLGLGVVVGDAVWDRASRAKISVGPLHLKQYLDFLPGGTAHQPLEALTAFFANGEIIFEVQLILDRDSVPACQLGIDSDSPPKLGWLTWMPSTLPRASDPGDTVFLLN